MTNNKGKNPNPNKKNQNQNQNRNKDDMRTEFGTEIDVNQVKDNTRNDKPQKNKRDRF